jgi:hypothetical protein
VGAAEGYGASALALGTAGVGASLTSGQGIAALDLESLGVGAVRHAGQSVITLALGTSGTGTNDREGYGIADLVLACAGVGQSDPPPTYSVILVGGARSGRATIAARVGAVSATARTHLTEDV